MVDDISEEKVFDESSMITNKEPIVVENSIERLLEFSQNKASIFKGCEDSAKGLQEQSSIKGVGLDSSTRAREVSSKTIEYIIEFIKSGDPFGFRLLLMEKSSTNSCLTFMADQHSNKGSSMGNSSGEFSDSIVVLRIKTLHSPIFSFSIDKNTLVLLFKERIAKELGVPIGQQRLIFRGKILKDDHILTKYHVENGHILHLVERQPAQSRILSYASSEEVQENNTNRRNAATSSVPRNQVEQISHSVVLGIFNVGDQGDGGVPDFDWVIGTTLNSFGVGGQFITLGTITQSSTFTPRGNKTNGECVVGENQAGNQAQSFLVQSFQVLSNFLSAAQPHTSTIKIRDQPKVVLPSNARGRLEQEMCSYDLAVREQIQTESVQACLTKQHLGSFLLKLGRNILMLYMGHSPAKSSVNHGPKVYIFPFEPNLIMVQLFHLQIRSLFSGFYSPSNPPTVGSVGLEIRQGTNISTYILAQ